MPRARCCAITACLAAPRIDGTSLNGLLGYCRAGFEPELAAELSARADTRDCRGDARTERNRGYVVFVGSDSATLSRALRFDTLIFARQKLAPIAELRGLGADDEAHHGAPHRSVQRAFCGLTQALPVPV